MKEVASESRDQKDFMLFYERAREYINGMKMNTGDTEKSSNANQTEK